jgi:hypothetical protein
VAQLRPVFPDVGEDVLAKHVGDDLAILHGRGIITPLKE